MKNQKRVPLVHDFFTKIRILISNRTAKVVVEGEENFSFKIHVATRNLIDNPLGLSEKKHHDFRGLLRLLDLLIESGMAGSESYATRLLIEGPLSKEHDAPDGGHYNLHFSKTGTGNPWPTKTVKNHFKKWWGLQQDYDSHTVMLWEL